VPDNKPDCRPDAAGGETHLGRGSGPPHGLGVQDGGRHQGNGDPHWKEDKICRGERSKQATKAGCNGCAAAAVRPRWSAEAAARSPGEPGPGHLEAPGGREPWVEEEECVA
jgi:hypothetical protein